MERSGNLRNHAVLGARVSARRALGAFESAQVLTNGHFAFNVVTVLALEPGPEPDVLRRALAVLRARHPLLRARVGSAGGRREFVLEATSELPLTLIQHPWPEDWRRLAERELNTGFDTAVGPLLRLTALLAPEGRVQHLVIAAQHAIFDGASGAHWVGELLSVSELLAAGREPEGFGPLPLNGPPEAYFPSRYRGWRGVAGRLRYLAGQLTDEAAVRWHGRGGRDPKLVPGGRCRVHPVVLSAETTAAIARRCRRERVTVNSFLCAAQLRAAAERLPALPALRHYVFANLRPYLEPTLGPEHLASCVAMLALRTDVRAGDVWALARRVSRQVHAAAKRGEWFSAVALSRRLMALVLGQRRFRMGHAGLAYGGGVRLAEEQGRYRLTALHAFVSNFWLGPPYTANARRFGGRLYWDMVYLDGDMDEAIAAGVAEAVCARLAQV